ncbi:MAG: hypothetical protein ACTHKG_14375 [Nocardioides sp.]
MYFSLSSPESAVLPRPAPDTSGSNGRDDLAAGLLEDLGRGLSSGDRNAVLALAARGDKQARAELGDMIANVRRLGIADLSMRYVDEDAGRQRDTSGRRLPERAWVADVQLDWRLRRYDRSSSHLEVSMVFRQTKAGVRFVTARNDYGQQAPLWLLDRLAVRQSNEAMAAVAGNGAEASRFLDLARTAVVDVRKVFPRWHGRLVVEVPGSQDVLDRVLDSDSSYDAIAAVTAPVDGSLSPSAPTHIFVNPPVFDPLGPRGAQIVLSHEAAHVATDAAISSMPTWLLEGFADYVALAHVDLPVEVTASQILQQVRDGGVPEHLPGQKDFASESKTLGASYEAAWLACRLIAQEYGEDKLIAFYRRADQGSSTAAAFKDVLGTTEKEFTGRWRGQLRNLAS